jgi:hypothetical protein
MPANRRGPSDRMAILRLSNKAALGAGVLNTATQDQMVVPYPMILYEVMAMGETITGAATIALWVNGATCLSSAITISADGTVYYGNLAQPDGVKLAKGDILTMRCTTASSTGEMARSQIIAKGEYR